MTNDTHWFANPPQVCHTLQEVKLYSLVLEPVLGSERGQGTGYPTEGVLQAGTRINVFMPNHVLTTMTLSPASQWGWQQMCVWINSCFHVHGFVSEMIYLGTWLTCHQDGSCCQLCCPVVLPALLMSPEDLLGKEHSREAALPGRLRAVLSSHGLHWVSFKVFIGVS